MKHFVVVDAGEAIPERRWQVWKVCVSDGQPEGCPYDLFCECIRTEDGALAELVSEFAAERIAREAAQYREADLEESDLEVQAERERRKLRAAALKRGD